MTAKSRDCYGNWRDLIVGVRCSEEHYHLVNTLAEQEGVSRSDFIRSCLQNSEIRSRKNENAFLSLKPHYDNMISNLQVLCRLEGVPAMSDKEAL